MAKVISTNDISLTELADVRTVGGEVIAARGTNGSLSGRLSGIDDTIGNLKKVIDLNVEDFPIIAPEADDTARVQRALDYAYGTITSSAYSTSLGDKYARVRLTKSRYNIGRLYMRSNVHIQGAGMYLTRINPTGTSGYVFDVQGTTTLSRLANVVLSDFTIAPTNNSFVSLQTTGRANVGGINYTYTTHCHIKDVQIFNIAGIGLNTVEVFDGYFENVTIEGVGTDANTPGLTLYEGTADLTNACKFIGCRIENCPVMLKISGHVTGRPPRQNQFIACKFEWGTLFTKAAAGIIIEDSAHNIFTACMFITKENNYPLVSVQTTGYDIRGLKFDSCDCQSPTPNNGWFMDVQGAQVTNVQIIGGSASGLLKTFTGTRITVSNFECYDCTTPIFDLNNSKLIGVTMKAVKGTDYAVKLNTHSKFVHGEIEGIDTTIKGVALNGSYNYVSDNRLTTLAEGVFIGANYNTVMHNDPTSVTTEINMSSTYAPNCVVGYGITGTPCIAAAASGRTNGKPAGSRYYDTTLVKYLTSDGTKWRDENGTLAWTASTAYALNDVMVSDKNVYQVTVAGTTGSTMPSHTTGTAASGSVTLQFLKTIV